MSYRQPSRFISLALPHFDEDDEDDSQVRILRPRTPWWCRGRIIAIVLALLMILLGGFLLLQPNRMPPISYQTERVTQGNLVLTFSSTGALQGNTYNINFPTTSVPGTSATLIQIIYPSVLQVVAYVNESDMANVKVGDAAQFTVSAYGNRVFTGVVSAISPNGVVVSNVVTFPVYITLNTNDLQGVTLLPGMTVNLTIDVVRRSNVLLIPVNAVNFARTSTVANTTTGTPALISQEQVTTVLGQARQMLQQLQHQHPAFATGNPMPTFVLELSNGQIVAKPVVLGLTDGTNYEVLAGLSAGESVIVGVAEG
jgi:multidrug efflux pump subunit AcrA (membrane-fusion protein)